MCLYFKLTLWKPSGFLVICLTPGEKRTNIYSPPIRHGRPTSDTIVLNPNEVTGVTYKSRDERFLRGANLAFQSAVAGKSLGPSKLIGQLGESSAQESAHCQPPIHAPIPSEGALGILFYELPESEETPSLLQEAVFPVTVTGSSWKMSSFHDLSLPPRKILVLFIPMSASFPFPPMPAKRLHCTLWLQVLFGKHCSRFHCPSSP